MNATQSKNDALTRLLKNELELVEEYDRVLNVLSRDEDYPDLQRLEFQHRDAALWLREKLDRQDSFASPAAQITPARSTSAPKTPVRRRFPWEIAAFAIVAIFATLLILILTTGGIPVWLLIGFASLFLLGVIHYFVWGKAVRP